MSDIFISYAHEDSEFVHKLADVLHERGARLWIDSSDIPAGHDWRVRVGEGLEKADVLLLVLSPNSTRSPEVAKEWRHFLKVKKPIIPILYQDTLLPKALKHLIYLRFDNQPFEVVLDRLVDELKTRGIRFQQQYSEAKVLPVVTPTAVRQPIDWTKWGVIIAAIAVIVGAMSTIAQPFIENWLSQPSTPIVNNTPVQATSLPINSGALLTETSVPATQPFATIPTVIIPVPTAQSLATIPPATVSLSLGLGSQDTLTLMIASEADLIGLSLVNANGGGDTPVSTFEVLGVLGGRVESGTCLIYRREGTNESLPRDCDPSKTYEVQFSTIDVFWYDDAQNRSFDIIVLREQENVTVCTTTSPRCNFLW